MAEAFLKKMGGDVFDVESAGLEPGTLNPFAVEAMREVGIDISGNKTKSVFDLFKQGRMYSHVITVCDESMADKCPIFPGLGKKMHWSFPDPSQFTGTHQEKLAKTIAVRDAIMKKVEELLKDLA